MNYADYRLTKDLICCEGQKGNDVDAGFKQYIFSISTSMSPVESRLFIMASGLFRTMPCAHMTLSAVSFCMSAFSIGSVER